jgi:hypothetical protein
MVFWHSIRNITTAFHLIDDLSLSSAGSRKPGVSFWAAGLGLLHVDLLVTAVGNVFLTSSLLNLVCVIARNSNLKKNMVRFALLNGFLSLQSIRLPGIDQA